MFRVDLELSQAHVQSLHSERETSPAWNKLYQLAVSFTAKYVSAVYKPNLL